MEKITPEQEQMLITQQGSNKQLEHLLTQFNLK